MKNSIGHRILIFAVAVCAMWSFAGCRKSDTFLSKPTDGVSLELSISSLDFDPVGTRATAASEQRIHSMALLIFKHNGKLHSIHFYPHTSGGTLGVDTNPGKELRLVGVANYTSVEGLEEKLRNVDNYYQLGDIVLPNMTLEQVREKGLVQYGEGYVPIITNKDKEYATLKMGYIHSRVQLNIEIGDIISTGTFLHVNDITYESLASGVTMIESASGIVERYEDMPISWTTSEDGSRLSATAYVCANMSGGRISKPAPDGGIQETASNSHMFKRHYAPENASRARILATYGKMGHTQELALYIYFGKNDHDDYNVERSEKHTYGVVVKGMENIYVDTNIEIIGE